MDEDELQQLLSRQDGVIARRQALAAELTDNDLRRRLRRREWAVVEAGVYVTHTGPLTWRQRAWAAVLALWPAALCHDTAIRAADGPGRRDFEDAAPLHVAVDRDRSFRTVPESVVLHRLADFDDKVQWNLAPPRVRIEEAVLDVAAEAKTDFGAIAALANAVQSRRTTAQRLAAALAERKRVGRRAVMAGALADIGEGTCSLLEQGYLDRVERAHGLPQGQRQVGASASGPIYRDVTYGAQCLVVELDGRQFHDSAAARDRDLDRDLHAAMEGLTTLRIGWGQVFERPCMTAQRISTLLQQRGWQGEPSSCPACRRAQAA